MSASLPVTQLQLDYVRDLQRRLRLPDHILDTHCASRFGVPFAGLDRRQASQLIDELKGWTAIPADLQRAMGQRDLPGMEIAL